MPLDKGLAMGTSETATGKVRVPVNALEQELAALSCCASSGFALQGVLPSGLPLALFPFLALVPRLARGCADADEAGEERPRGQLL